MSVTIRVHWPKNFSEFSECRIQWTWWAPKSKEKVGLIEKETQKCSVIEIGSKNRLFLGIGGKNETN